jgi:hypothetical protein
MYAIPISQGAFCPSFLFFQTLVGLKEEQKKQFFNILGEYFE